MAQRPYFSMATDFQDQIASIMLIKNGYTESSATKLVNDIDYLNNLNTEIIPMYTVDNPKAKGFYDGYIFSRNRQASQSQFNINQNFMNNGVVKGVQYQVFDNFSVSTVQENKEEIVSLIQHFGGSFSVFTFGTSPMVYTFSGVFLDSENMPHYQDFENFYDNFFKASKSSMNDVSCLLSCNGKIMDGLIINLRANVEASQPKLRGFTFNFVIKKYFWVRFNNLGLSNEMPIEKQVNNNVDINNNNEVGVFFNGGV
jgi:hypothetical protein